LKTASAVLGDIADKRFHLLRSMLPFRGLSASLSVSLSCLCVVLKRQKISTRFLLHTTAPCLSQIVLKFGLHRSTLPPHIFPKVTQSMLISASAKFDGKLRPNGVVKGSKAQWSQRRIYRKALHYRSFDWYYR